METDWNAIRRMEAAAAQMNQAADRAEQAAHRAEQAAHRIAMLLEDGYGGNGLRLIELLENAAKKEG